MNIFLKYSDLSYVFYFNLINLTMIINFMYLNYENCILFNFIYLYIVVYCEYLFTYY